MMVSEYAEGGDLEKFLKKCKGGKAPLEKVFKFGRQIAFALGQLHSIGILHRDLTLSNVVLSDVGNIKFSDLGSCGIVRPFDYEYNGNSFNAFAVENQDHRIIYEGISPSNHNKSSILVLESECLPHPLRRLRRRRSLVGNFGYLAPEVCLSALSSCNEGYNFSADWFSLGCLLYKLATGKLPFKSSGKPTAMGRRKQVREKEGERERKREKEREAREKRERKRGREFLRYEL
jgi:serine/threonine protein kinase